MNEIVTIGGLWDVKDYIETALYESQSSISCDRSSGNVNWSNVHSPKEADLALAFLIDIACSLASAADSASPRAPATFLYLARLRAASLIDLSDLRRFLLISPKCLVSAS